MVALDLDGVLRIPNAVTTERRVGVVTAEIVKRNGAFPWYSHDEPPWDARDEWRAVHTFSGPGAAWVEDLLARGAEVVWAST